MTEAFTLVPPPDSLRPFFSYYGGKWRAAPRYPSPRYGVIVEPFAGSAGYSVRHNSHRVVLCDKDPIIAGVWRYLIGAKEGEIMRLPVDVESVDDLDGVPQEARWLIGFWLNRGAASPRKTPSAWMRSGVKPDSFWGTAIRARVAGNLKSIRHWEVYVCDYRDCPVTGPATWFIDPPYIKAGCHYRCGPNEIDFDQLGEWCESRVGQSIVCEAQGAKWLPFTAFEESKSMAGTSSEAIWTSA